MPYQRDRRLARPWALPGTEGLTHRLGGLEKEDVTGNVCYDPENHQHMTNVRAAKIAMDRGVGGPLLAPSSYFMKSPSVQYHDSVAHDNVEAFIADQDNTVEDLARFLLAE